MGDICLFVIKEVTYKTGLELEMSKKYIMVAIIVCLIIYENNYSGRRQ